jgi:muconolactone delta-isomerase
MALFLVHISVALPDNLDDEVRTCLVQDELARGRQLIEDGMLVSIWRTVGRFANVGIWNASGHEQLHAAITSLPMWRYMTVTVTALSSHPLSADHVEIRGALA